MTIVNGLDDLSPEEFGLKLWHLPIGLHFEVSMQAASINEFHDEEDLLVGLKDFKQLSDMLMIQLFHNFHFAFDTLAPVRLH